MWRFWKEALASTSPRSRRLSHNIKVNRLIDGGEKIANRLTALAWSHPGFEISYLNPSPYISDKLFSCCSFSSGGTRFDEWRSRTQSQSFPMFSRLEASYFRGFMSKAETRNEAEKVEGKESFDSEDEEELEGRHNSKNDEFEDLDVAEEEDPIGDLANPLEKEDEKADKEKEILWKRILRVRASSRQSVLPVILKWKEQGRELNKGFVIAYITRLRKMARYTNALQISEWVITEKPFELDASDYAFRIDLLGRLGQMKKAEKFFQELPSEFKTSMAYSILLMNYVKQGNIKMAEQLFEEMKKLDFISSPFNVNQMIRLYIMKSKDEKILLMLDEAKSAGFEPDIFTYNLLMKPEAKSRNIEALEKIFEEVKANTKVKPNARTYGTVASGYITANMQDKAELFLKRMETGNYAKTPSMYNALLKMYGQLKNDEEVERIWQTIKKLPRQSNYSIICLLEAFSYLDSAEGAKKAFEDMEKIVKGKQRTATSLRLMKRLLNVYQKFGLSEKAEELEKFIRGDAGSPDALSLHSSVEELVKLDDLDKALETLKANMRKGAGVRPLFDTFTLVLEKLAEKGDVKTAEQIFEACRGARYAKNIKLWNTLLKTYVKADTPAYGFRQRMFADRVFPNVETQKLFREAEP